MLDNLWIECEAMSMTPDVNCCMADLPTTIPAFVASNTDGSYTIILNARLSREQHLKSYEHEMKHILNGDYERKCPADLIEIWARR